MPSKTVPFSVRIPHEDAEFISQMKISGAKTPSDKLRAIISDTRRRSTQEMDYSGCLKTIQQLIGPAAEKIRHSELENQVHSEPVLRTIEWLPDLVAFFVSSVHRQSTNLSKEALVQIEDGIVDRVFRIMESILQMGVIRKCPCYEPNAIHKRKDPILELAKVISNQ